MPIKPIAKRKPWQTKRVSFGRRKDNSKFYNATKWRKVSIAFREANPFCVTCKEKGVLTATAVADHKRGLQVILDTGGNPYSYDELQGQCHPCHNAKSGSEAHRGVGGRNTRKKK